MCKDIMGAAPRILIGLFFLIAGLMKFFIPGAEGFSGMIDGSFGIGGGLGVFVAWLVIIAEIGGGAVLILGKMVPKKLYVFSIRVLVVISVAAGLVVHGVAALSAEGMAMMGEVNSMFKALIIAAVLVQICHSKIVCPMGLTGEKRS